MVGFGLFWVEVFPAALLTLYTLRCDTVTCALVMCLAYGWVSSDTPVCAAAWRASHTRHQPACRSVMGVLAGELQAPRQALLHRRRRVF